MGILETAVELMYLENQEWSISGHTWTPGPVADRREKEVSPRPRASPVPPPRRPLLDRSAELLPPLAIVCAGG